ncbi:MAG TPA: tetratricopeptide repeat-containing serine protease family protein [Verrucomicrobiae bacterium]|nr:tetratricopeptide repeat-containing serine protease family protein [Verrucomicrobiae bacterium]
MCYHKGEGVAQDDADAAKWCRKAAEQGSVYAQYNLGRWYDKGQGVSKDYVEAAKWYRKAAEQGDAIAQDFIGYYYCFGQGVTQDYVEAVKWYRKAAEQGNAEAQGHLAVSYGKGEGVPQHYVEAYQWANLAAAQGVAAAQVYRNSLAELMTPEMVAEGQRRSTAFMAKQEGTTPGDEDSAPRPEIAEGKVFAGTGFFVTDDGYLVTCEHVVHGAISFHAKTANGYIRASLVATDPGLDIAVLKVSGAFPALAFATEPRVKLGDSVFTIGFPNADIQGVAPKLTRGEVSSLSGIRDDSRYFQISVPV